MEERLNINSIYSITSSNKRKIHTDENFQNKNKLIDQIKTDNVVTLTKLTVKMTSVSKFQNIKDNI